MKEYEVTVLLHLRFAASDRQEARAKNVKIVEALRSISPFTERNYGMLLTSEVAVPRCVDNGRKRLG